MFTYLQYDSPFGFEIQFPPFLHGDGAHEVNPEKKNKINISHMILNHGSILKSKFLDKIHLLIRSKSLKLYKIDKFLSLIKHHRIANG